MNQVAVLLKLKAKYPDKDFSELFKRFDPDGFGVKWVSKTGSLQHSIEELFGRLSVNLREELFLALFKHLYPDAVVSKHPQKRVWLFKLGVHKFFFEVQANKVVMPMGVEEPRLFTAGKFVTNLPKLQEFLDYLSTYSMRNRRRFSF